MASTVVDFKLRFPEFCNVDDPRVDLFLEDAALLMGDEGRWLDFFKVAHEHYAAHLLIVSLAQKMGDIGALAPVKKQEVDDVIFEQAVGDMQPTADELLSTSYGKRYYQYRRICFTPIIGV